MLDQVAQLAMRDLVALPVRERLQRALWRLMFSWYSDAPREEHIFLRARRGARFRWYAGRPVRQRAQCAKYP